MENELLEDRSNDFGLIVEIGFYQYMFIILSCWNPISYRICINVCSSGMMSAVSISTVEHDPKS